MAVPMKLASATRAIGVRCAPPVLSMLASYPFAKLDTYYLFPAHPKHRMEQPG